MTPRIDLTTPVAAGALQAMFGLERQVRQAGFEKGLLDLMRMRASQINGCAYCLDMHSKDARAHGETEQRLYGLSAWRETPYYSERERAALEWTEAVTRVADGHVPDEVYARARDHFSEEELLSLTIAVIATNSFNRLNIAFRPEVGDYRPGMFDKPETAQAR
ncbi:MAG TPA: carboxymuconolactone decarboxylase family protein [Terriglobia bacterium]|nr:carboxymuconolactone decarboxylase family protein [Terriglobia bacterium]